LDCARLLCNAISKCLALLLLIVGSDGDPFLSEITHLGTIDFEIDLRLRVGCRIAETCPDDRQFLWIKRERLDVPPQQ